MADQKRKSCASRTSLFCLFTITPFLFVLSWFCLFRTSHQPQLLDPSSLPRSSKLRSIIDDVKSQTFSGSGNKVSRSSGGRNVETNTGNRVILADDGGKKGKEKVGDEKGHVGDQKRVSDVNFESSSKEPLRVYMYDLDPEFHFELLDWKRKGGSVWPDIRTEIPTYPGGLNLQHSIEYWLTLDLLASELDGYPNSLAARRVQNSSEADVIFVPFFSSLSYNRYSKAKPQDKKSRNKVLQNKIVRFLTSREEWRRSGGRDHIVMAHHPNSMLDARSKLWPATFILSDFGRYPPSIANVEKDVIAPYKHLIRSYVNDTSDFDSRPILLYFQGAINRKDGGLVRQQLYYLLQDEKDVHFSFGSIGKDGVRKATQGMHSSKFCLNIAGDTPSSNRLFDAIASHCVPVIISDLIELPYEDVLDYSRFTIFVRSVDALKEKYLLNLIKSIKRDEWMQMWRNLKEVEHLYEFQFPAKEGDAVQMIWQAIARKVPSIRRKVNKSRRYLKTVTRKERGLSYVPAPNTFW